jgi:predicted kinase
MKRIHLLIVTGLPASGKTTLARELARRHGAILIAKDVIKEPLLDVLGAADAAASRALSDASFAILFAMARELAGSTCDLVLEGNFRPGQHEESLRPLFGAHVAGAQLLCRVPESVRRARLLARAQDPSRHAGHRDAQFLTPAAPAAGSATDGFLELPGARFESIQGAPDSALDEWWQKR